MAQIPDKESIEQAEKDWNAAIKNQDAAEAQKFMAQDYVLVGVRSTGTNTVERDVWLRSLGAMRLYSYQADVIRVRVYGESAVVSVKGGWHIAFQGQEIDENFFLTDVWVKRPDGWKVVLRHSSPYPRQEKR